MATGDNIRRQRKAKGFTQAQLADAVGLTEGAIRHYESGIRAVKPELLEEIAKALGVSEGALKDVFRQVKIDKYVCRISTPSC